MPRRTSRTMVASVLATIAVFAADRPAVADTAVTAHGYLTSLTCFRAPPCFTTIDAPSALTATYALGVNDPGQIVGNFDDATGIHGYLRDLDGSFTRIDFPDALSTFPHRINDSGQIVGVYVTDPAIGRRGFLLDHNRFTTIHVKGATRTDINGINDLGQAVGWYLDTAGRTHGLLWDAGRYTTVDIPGQRHTFLFDINNAGQMVGGYSDNVDVEAHGVVIDTAGHTTFDVPRAPFTFLDGINEFGQIVLSTYNDPAGTIVHGYLLSRGVTGPLTPLEVPGAARSEPFSISGNGLIAGYYEDARSAEKAHLWRASKPVRLTSLPGSRLSTTARPLAIQS